MKIGKKLVLKTAVVNLICIGSLTIAFLMFTKSQISIMACENARSIAENSGNKISAWFGSYMSEVRAVGQIMSHAEAVNREDRRTVFNSMLQSIAEENPELLAVWAVFEPDALDDMDAEFVNTPGTDATGRFISIFSRENGSVSLAAATGYNNEGAKGDYYFVSFRSGNEAIIEPYYYVINGTPRLITSLTIPVKQDEKIIGVVGVDIELAEIQKLTEAIKPFGAGDAAVFSNGGLVAAHPDPERLGRDMRETERDTAGSYLPEMVEAVRLGNDLIFQNYWAKANSDMLIALNPINVGYSMTPWSFAVSVPVKTIMAPVYRMTSILIALGVFMLGILTIIIFFAARFKIDQPEACEAAARDNKLKPRRTRGWLFKKEVSRQSSQAAN